MPLDMRELQALEPNARGLINLESYSDDSFSIFGYELSSLLDDVILVKYVDMTEDGKSIVRNGIHLPINTMQKAWRIGHVILAGHRCTLVADGDYVCFPHDKGVPVSNLNVKGHGQVRDAVFVNEQRIFGVCNKLKLDETNASNSTNSKKRSTGKRSRNKVPKKDT